MILVFWEQIIDILFIWFLLMDIFLYINNLLWNYAALWILLFGGLYFSFCLRFVQITYFITALKSLINQKKSSHHISSIQALCTSLAQRVGTGNLAGVATALSAGGEGAIFWMWVSAILGSATSFVECSLAQIFKVNKKEGFFGGPAYYMHKGLNNKKIAVLFSFLLIISMGFVLNAVQSNTVTQGLAYALKINNLNNIAIVISIISGLIIFGGLKRIAKAAELVVPIMALIYLLLTIWVIINNFSLLPAVIIKIFNKAFSWQSLGGGVLGVSIKEAFRYGVARGLYSNEAGWGSAPNAAASALVNHPVEQGLLQMIAVYIDTLLICSCTAFMILLAPIDIHASSGIALTQQAASFHFGDMGNLFIAIAIILFGVTTILGNTFYGEVNIKFLSSQKEYIIIYRLIVIMIIFLGSLIEVPLIWQMADMISAIMTIINMICIILLGHLAQKALTHFADIKNRSSFSLSDIDLHLEDEELAFNQIKKNLP